MMRPMSRKYCVLFLVSVILIDLTYSTDNGTVIENNRRARVSGRIVKLYSGPKPDPVLCLREGFQNDAADCSVFYRCLKASNGKYAVYRFQCGPGTIYDPETETCNHPGSTKRSECGGLRAEKPVSSTEKLFENEIDGLHKENSEVPSPISTKAPFTTVVLANKLESSYMTTANPWATISNHGYQGAEVVSTASSWSEPTSLSTKNPSENSVSEVTYSVTQQSSSSSVNQCTSDGFMGDNEDCRKFYRCVNNQRGGYIRYEFSCSESTIWDDDTQDCNHPWAVKRRLCGKGSSYDENTASYMNQIKNNDITPNKTIQQQTQISYGSKVTQSQLQISNGTAIQNQTQINFGDRLEQKKSDVKQNQTQISYGSAISQYQTQINYGSKATQTQLQIDHSNQSSQVQSQIAEFSTPPTITTSTQYIKDSNSKCTKEGFMGDSNDCKKFYRCLGNGKGGFNKYEFSCSEGTLWDEKLEACNHAWAVKECGAKVSSQNTPSMGATITYSTPNYYTTKSFSYINNEIEDEIGYENQNNKQEQEESKLSTQTINMVVTSESLIAHETDCKSSGFFGNSNDCSKFYRCVENGRGGFTKYDYKCGEGTVWDPEIESCNHAWTVKQCSNDSQNDNSIKPTSTEKAIIITTVSLIQSTTQKNVQENDYDSGYGSLQKETPPPFTSSTEPIVNQGKDCTKAGFMGDNNDCKKFYRCVENGHGNFSRHNFTCGEGTVWDSKIESCNHIWAVDKCGESVINDNNISQAIISHTVPDESAKDDNGYNTNIDDGHTSLQTTTPSITTTNIYGFTNKDSQCNKNGFLGDRNNCKIFYRCVETGNGDFVRYEFSCGEGTVWDPKISACNHVWAVENCGGTLSENKNISNPSTQDNKSTVSYIDSDMSTKSTTQHASLSPSTVGTSTISTVTNECVSDGFIGDKYDCKKFYRCVADDKGSFIQYEFSCGEGTLWDSKIAACNHAWAVESCGSHLSLVTTASSSISSITIKDDVTDASYVTQNNQPASGSTENNPWSTSTIRLPTGNSDRKECTTEGLMGDNNDCKKFYRCVGDGRGSFIRYEFTCSEGTVWDSEINACNHVNAVKAPCNSISSQDTKETEPGPNYTLASSPFESNDYSTTLKPKKSYQCQQEGFVGDKNDCKKFYRCVNNGKGGFHKYEFTCGEGTTWDQKILACNHDSSDRQCGNIDTESHTENNEPSVSYSMSTPLNVTEPTDETAIPLNKDKCTSEGFYPNSNDCKKFYRCVNDNKGSFTKFDFTCGESTVWVQDLQACDHDSDGSYCNKSTISGTTPFHSSQEQPLTTTAMSISSTTNRATSTAGDKYSTQSSHKPASSKEDDCQSEGYFASDTDCKIFYQCVNNGEGGYSKHEFTCSEGTAWDINIKSCNYISEVKRCHDSNQIYSETNTTMQDEAATESSSTTESLPNSSTTTSVTIKDNCVESGYFGNTKDCKQFYRCVDNGKGGFTKYDYTCGDGTIWDQDIVACNHPQDVSNPSCINDESSTATITTMTTKVPTTTTKTTLSTDSSTGSTTNQNTYQSTQEVSTIKPNNNNYTCTKAGFYGDPYDCKKFYRCVDWAGDGKSFSIFHFDCGEGTIWDPEVQTCNHENSVYPPRDCSKTQSQNEKNNETVTTERTTTKQEGTSTEETSTTSAAQPTTQKSTTQESSTTSGSSTATDETSTQQSFSSEQTSSTQQSTMQPSTTKQSTTQQSTTGQSTTQQSTTISEQTTSQQSSTTQQATTTEQTTSTTTDQTTTTTKTTTTTTTEKSTQKTTEQPTTTTEQPTTTQTTEQPTTTTTTEQPTTTTTTEQPTTTTEQSTTIITEETTTSAQTTTGESTTVKQTTKAEETTTQESNPEQTSENQSSTTQQPSTTPESTEGSTTTESGQVTTTEKESSENECPEIDEDQYLYVCPTGFRRHPKYCNLFYQCTENEENHEVKVAVFNCPNNTIYDESKIQCVEEQKADKKCDGQIAQKRRVKRLDTNYKEPITVSTGNYLCPAVGHFPFEKNEECSPVLFKCESTKTGKLRGLVYQCPEGYVYWSISRRCEPITAMTDCKMSRAHWNGRYEIPIERKNIARKK